MELEKVLSGKQVVHKKLGQGLIEKVSESYLVVRFDKGERVSKFVYPDAFECFLTLSDDDTQAIVDKHLRIKKLIDAEQERRRKQEMQKLEEELSIKHKEELLKKRKAAMAKLAREKRLKEKKSVPV